MSEKKFLVLTMVVFLLLVVVPGGAAAPAPGDIPPNLAEWKGWVLHGNEERLCPTHYDDGNAYQCVWPSRLHLSFDKGGGTFTQNWLVFSESWVPLPGNRDVWPQEVTVDGKLAPVVSKGTIPSVHLTSGGHRVEGAFLWKEMPETITISPESGLVSVTISGNPLELPYIESSGHLWLRKKDGEARQEDRAEFRIFRLLKDTIPLEVTNLLKIDISGQPREITLAPVLLEKSIPLKIASSLPSRLGPNGELVIQGRPGQWEVELATRFTGPVNALRPAAGRGNAEVWSFAAENQLRMVKIEGVSPIDPKQTDIPVDWQRFPTFMMKPDSEMKFKEIRRGDPSPSPDQLNLNRTWWLDFDGKGFTVQDTITGTLSRQWYLAMNPPNMLGRVSVDNVDQLITSHGKEKKPGVELRRGHLFLVAESRCEASPCTVPAVGWDHDLQSLSGVLNLPPGWKLLAARGVDVATGTWFERWTLLDLFVVLVISLAIAKLWNKKWGLFALFAVALTYHEPGAPRLVWLSLLAALALLRFLPSGWARTVVDVWRWGSVLFLLVLAIPFMVEQVRWGVYPQLEPHDEGVVPMAARKTMTVSAPEDIREVGPEPAPSNLGFASRAKVPLESKAERSDREKEIALTQDPHALIQTGPGLPAWRWRTIVLTWNGPVSKDQKMHLWLLSPFVNLILAFIRVGLLATLIFFLIPVKSWKISGITTTSTAVLLLFLALSTPLGHAKEDPGYPPPQLLEELRERVLEKADCLPQCAESPWMHLFADGHSFRIRFGVHGGTETAVPLPCPLRSWMPQEVLIDDHPASGLMKDRDGLLWAYIPEGVHTITLRGKPPLERSLQIPLPLRPRKVEAELKGWTILGLTKEGRAESSLQLTREAQRETQTGAILESGIPPFFTLERLLTLGLTWQVHNRLRRVTEPDRPALVNVPLLIGESVTTAGITVENGQARINFSARDTEVAWVSALKESPLVELKAAENVPWTEHWTLDASPIWHCELTGLNVIYHQDQAGYWMPRWQPWPGESVTINVSRPQAVQGEILTVERVKLDLTPGERYLREALALTVRSSKGGQHRITLPKGADLLQVSINGQSQPAKKEGDEVVIPLQPGLQNITLDWNESEPVSFVLRGPLVSIGSEAVNADVSFSMPPKRWILWARGPRLGPAVLFWSYVVVIVLAAFALGRISWTPLRTRQWLLLGLGLTQVHVITAIIIVGWLLFLGLRKLKPQAENRLSFNATQFLLAIWTAGALACLYFSVQSGLLGIPDMQISGNGSSNFFLHWTQDRIGSTLPRPWVFSLPLFVFRILMLLWALWLAYSLLNWLRWGWQCFSEGGLWKRKTR